MQRGAVGAALAAMHTFKGQPRNTNGGDGMFGSFLGPAFPNLILNKGSLQPVQILRR